MNANKTYVVTRADLSAYVSEAAGVQAPPPKLYSQAEAEHVAGLFLKHGNPDIIAMEVGTFLAARPAA